MSINSITNKKYIGAKLGEFDPEYVGSGVSIRDAIKELGKDSFTVELIENVTGTVAHLGSREVYWQTKYDVKDSPEFYNRNIQGFSNRANLNGHLSKETVRKRVETNKKKYGHGNGGATTPEAIAKRTATNMERYGTPYPSGLHSKESREKSAKSKKGVPISKESLRKRNETCTLRYVDPAGQTHTPEVINTVKNSKKIRGVMKWYLIKLCNGKKFIVTSSTYLSRSISTILGTDIPGVVVYRYINGYSYIRSRKYKPIMEYLVNHVISILLIKSKNDKIDRLSELGIDTNNIVKEGKLEYEYFEI